MKRQCRLASNPQRPNPDKPEPRWQIFLGKKKFSAVRASLDDPSILVPQNVPAFAGLNEIPLAGSSSYGQQFSHKKFNLHQNLVRKCKDLTGKRLKARNNKDSTPKDFVVLNLAYQALSDTANAIV